MQMAWFSERNGYVDPRRVLQTDEMDDNLRIGVYNELYDWLDLNKAPSLCEYVWTVFWHMPKDDYRQAYDYEFVSGGR